MKPKVVLHFTHPLPSASPDPFISLIDEHGSLAGAWRGDCLRWVTEALKPLAAIDILELVRLDSAPHPWDQFKSFEESLRVPLDTRPRCPLCGRLTKSFAAACATQHTGLAAHQIRLAAHQICQCQDPPDKSTIVPLAQPICASCHHPWKWINDEQKFRSDCQCGGGSQLSYLYKPCRS